MTESLRRRRTSNSIRTPGETSGSTLAYEVAGSGPPLILLHGLSGSAGGGQKRSRLRPQLSHLHGRSPRLWAKSPCSLVSVGRHRGQNRRLGRGRKAAASAYRWPLAWRRRRGAACRAPSGPHRPARARRCRNPRSGDARHPASGRLSRTPSDSPRRGSRHCWCATCCAAIPEASSRRRSTRCRPTGSRWRGSSPDARRLGSARRHHATLWGRDITAVVSGARLITLAEAGHNPIWECAEVFNTEVLRFLADGMAPPSNACHDQSSADLATTGGDHSSIG